MSGRRSPPQCRKHERHGDDCASHPATREPIAAEDCSGREPDGEGRGSGQRSLFDGEAHDLTGVVGGQRRAHRFEIEPAVAEEPASEDRGNRPDEEDREKRKWEGREEHPPRSGSTHRNTRAVNCQDAQDTARTGIEETPP